MAGVRFDRIDQHVMRGFARKTIPNATKPGSLLALRTRVLQPIISGQVTLSSPALVTMAAGLDLRISARLKELELAPAAAAAPLTEMLEQAPFLPPTPAPEVHDPTGGVAGLVEPRVEVPSTEIFPGTQGIIDQLRREISDLERALNAAKEELVRLREELAAANTARRAAEAAAAAAAARADEVRELADRAAADHQEKLAAATGDFRDQLARMEKRARELSAAIELLTRQWEEKVAENQRNAKEVAARRSALKNTEETRVKRLEEKKLAFAAVEDLIGRIKVLKEKQRGLAAAKPNLTIEELSQLAQLEKALQLLGKEAEPIEVRMLQKRMEAIKTNAAARARQELDGIERELAQLEEALIEAIQAKTRAIEAVGNVGGVIEHLSDLLRQAEKQLAATNQAALALFKQLNRLHQEKKELEITLAQLRERRRQFDLQQREIWMAFSAAASRVDNLLASIPPAPEEKTS